MCGFAGFLNFHARTDLAGERRRTLLAMGQAIAHRGPDDVQYYDDGSLALVFRRLAIVDVEGGGQPIFNETRDRLIVANGEIYNHLPLRRVLEVRHRFATHSDSEVALHAYEEWGDEALARLNGMFAIAIWDQKRRQLLLARDRMGIKPLYVCRLASGILFGSELKALLAHPKCPRELDWEAIGRTPTSQSPTTTYVDGIDFLAGGAFLTVSADGSMQDGRYWDIDLHLGTAPFGRDAIAYRNRYCDLLEETTLAHLQGDVEVGLHLSGGLDSSLLTAIIGRTGRRVPCFTVVERTTYRAGDVGAAKHVAEQFDLPWYPVLFDYRTLAADLEFDLGRLEQSVWMMDSPRFDLEWLFKAELHRVARAEYPNLKAIILGQGADEFAGGYSKRLDQPRANWAQYLREEVAPNLLANYSWQRGAPAHLCSLLRCGPPSARDAASPYHQMMRLMVRQLQHHNLWHEDRSSMWHGIEARVPYLDHRIVELLASVPAALHEELFWNKKIVRDAMRHFLPSHSLTRPKLAFLDSDDTRSTDIMLLAMVERVVPEFQDKYVDSSSFVFQRDKVKALIARVMARTPGFYQDTRQLLECMAITIFDHQCHNPPSAATDSFDWDAVPLKTVPAASWHALEAAMTAQPAVPMAWNLAGSVKLPEGAEVLTPLVTGGSKRYVLAAAGTKYAEIGVPIDHPWMDRFLSRIAQQDAELSIRDWIVELGTTTEEFLESLNVLYQCGFVLPPPAESLEGGRRISTEVVLAASR